MYVRTKLIVNYIDKFCTGSKWPTPALSCYEQSEWMFKLIEFLSVFIITLFIEVDF